MQPPFAPIPSHLAPLYRKLRIALWCAIAVMGAGVAYTFLFPTITTSFDFRNPKSSRNQIFDPRSDTGVARTNGKLEVGGKLIADTSPLGDFSHLSVAIDLEKRSESPDLIEVAVRKSYRAFLYPDGEALADFPEATLGRVDDTVYLLRDEMLHPFVSAAAFHSRYPDNAAIDQSAEWLARYPIASDFLGFRVGSLISFADGVYIVTSETEIRPIGSAEIFLALGLHFEDVIPVNEEDLGIYKRGRIFLMGAAHPDGTLFRDGSTGSFYLIEAGKRRLVTGPYRDFLLSKIHPIEATAPTESAVAHCDATAGLFPRALDCKLSLDPLSGSIGSDYEVSFSGNDADVDIASVALSFGTRLDANNAKTLAAKVKERILARFGLASR